MNVSRLWFFGSGSMVRLTTAPRIAIRATMTLVSPRPTRGSRVVTAQVPMKAPIFPAAFPHSQVGVPKCAAKTPGPIRLSAAPAKQRPD